jgi:hypothetical protein
MICSEHTVIVLSTTIDSSFLKGSGTPAVSSDLAFVFCFWQLVSACLRLTPSLPDELLHRSESTTLTSEGIGSGTARGLGYPSSPKIPSSDSPA